jgi:bifunctional DNA-binding transcriptional regulator/antitoxin component of YhaV-PrlF toxin-antitoxin module
LIFREIAMLLHHETTRLSSEGAVQLPDHIRDAHHWLAGMEFLVEETPEGVLLKPLVADTREHTRIEDVAGCLKSRRGHVVSLEEMEEGIAAEARERHARGRY